MRNEGARSLGFENYYSMSMQLDELDETELFALLDELEQGTQPLWERYKGDLDARLATRFGCPVEDPARHYADPFFQEAPATEVDLDPYYAGKNLEKLTEDYPPRSDSRSATFSISRILRARRQVPSTPSA